MILCTLLTVFFVITSNNKTIFCNHIDVMIIEDGHSRVLQMFQEVRFIFTNTAAIVLCMAYGRFLQPKFYIRCTIKITHTRMK
ncbi:hypothetical protein V1478_006488 [Vespula squamosa]|uniref:Secreted protein n=1 Tax=Vespula squamosa TaxID=30214 RepID=A0ABD2B7Z5_VESSQ